MLRYSRACLLPAAVFTGMLLSSSAAFAQLINPSGGTVLFDDSRDFDLAVAVNRNLGFTGKFFGKDHTTVDVSVKGNLNFDALTDWINGPMPFSPPEINVLWDDLAITKGSKGSIIEKVDQGVFYSVTWQNMQNADLPDPSSPRSTFQVIWFGQDTTLGQINFKKDDIVLDYVKVDAPFRQSLSEIGATATIGLDNGNGKLFVPLPGTTDGVVADDQKQLIPLLPRTDRFVLFRPDGKGSYTASIQSTVPAPGALITTLMGVVPGGLLLLRRRRRA